MTLADLALSVRAMREAQRKYFRYHDNHSLTEAKKLEYAVDKALDEILQDKNQQGKLL